MFKDVIMKQGGIVVFGGNQQGKIGHESFVTFLSLSIMFGMLMDSDTIFLVLAGFVIIWS